MLNALDLVLIGLAGIVAGVVNALAGGGSLITFPVLVFVGLPSVAANVTNTVALCPGYLGATLAQAKDLRGQQRRLLMLIPASIVGGLAGGILLLNTTQRLFNQVIPWLILMASLLLAVQTPLRAWLNKRAAQNGGQPGSEAWAIPAITLTAVYGGYFGAGLSVMELAVLGVLLSDTLTRLNALKQALSLSVNVAAAIFFLFSGQVVWLAALVMALGALGGGALGGRLAGRIDPGLLRRLVVAVGIGIAVIYFFRT